MFKKIFKAPLLLFSLSMLAFVACDKDEPTSLTDADLVENFTDESIGELQDEASCGRHGCFEFVFPIAIEFPDGTNAEADGYESLHEIISAWKEANPDAEERPSLVFPVDVVAANGDVHTIESQDELRELRSRCRRFFRGHGPRGFRGLGYDCFQLVFPVTIEFPNGETADAGSKRELKVLLHAWKRTHPLADTRPALQFPLDVELENGVIETVVSPEGLQALKEECGE